MAEQGSARASEAAQAEIQGLDRSGRELLAVCGEVLKDFHPQPGVLGGLPQITVGHRDTEAVCRLTKEDPRLALKRLLCLACVDYKDTFQLVYFLHSLEPERTLVVKTDVPCDDPHVPSVSSVWRAGEWYEREASDLFGVVFDGHPYPEPLLLYEGFEGYPGRREYPFFDYHEF